MQSLTSPRLLLITTGPRFQAKAATEPNITEATHKLHGYNIRSIPHGPTRLRFYNAQHSTNPSIQSSKHALHIYAIDRDRHLGSLA